MLIAAFRLASSSKDRRPEIVEQPVVDAGGDRVIGFRVQPTEKRRFPVDMAAFAVHLRLILTHTNARFHDPACHNGHFESCFLVKLNVSLDDFEPFGTAQQQGRNRGRQVLVWHTQTARFRFRSKNTEFQV